MWTVGNELRKKGKGKDTENTTNGRGEIIIEKKTIVEIEWTPSRKTIDKRRELKRERGIEIPGWTFAEVVFFHFVRISTALLLRLFCYVYRLVRSRQHTRSISPSWILIELRKLPIEISMSYLHRRIGIKLAEKKEGRIPSMKRSISMFNLFLLFTLKYFSYTTFRYRMKILHFLFLPIKNEDPFWSGFIKHPRNKFEIMEIQNRPWDFLSCLECQTERSAAKIGWFVSISRCRNFIQHFIGEYADTIPHSQTHRI